MKAFHGLLPNEMKEAWKKVFKSTEPWANYPHTLAFQYPFTAKIQAATICYPVDGYVLTERQFEVLKTAISFVRDDSYYVSTYEIDYNFLENPLVRDKPRHYMLTTHDGYSDYLSSVPEPLEYAMYSTTGAWGVIVSHWLHAIVGGSAEFINNFRGNYPYWMADIAALKDFWLRKPTGRWLEEIMPRIEGAKAISPMPHPDED